MKKFFLFLFLIGIVCLGGYMIKTQSTKKLNVISTTTTTQPTDKVSISNETIKEEKENYLINIIYPKTNNLVVNESIKTIIQEKIDNFKKAASEPSPNSQKMTLDINYSITINQNNVFCIKFESEDYTGGAHPGHNIFVKNYDLGNSVEIAFDQIVVDETALDILSEFAVEYFANKKLEFDLFPEGLEPKEENYKTFNLTKDSIIFYFNEYQIAPYVAGSFEMPVPYDVLGIITNAE